MQEEMKTDKSLSAFLRKERTSLVGAFVSCIVMAILEWHQSLGLASVILAGTAMVGLFTAAWYAFVYRRTGLSQQELSRRWMR